MSAYRPNGADAQDPIFRKALEQIGSDPEFAKWFKEEREFDQIIFEKLNSVQPPSDLKPAILAGVLTTALHRERFQYRWLALAAILLISCLILGKFNFPHPANQFDSFQSDMLALFHPLPDLDLSTDSFQQTQEFLKANAAPTAPNVPEELRTKQTAGCKVLQWRGHMVSLTCFELPNGHFLHLFVVNKEAFANSPIPHGFQKNGDWHILFSESDGMVLMWLSRAPMNQLQMLV